MNNLHRTLAPISDAAWADLEAEATRTFGRHVAGRRVVDVTTLAETDAAIGTGHLRDIAEPGPGVQARSRDARPLIELRVPFTVDRAAVDDVERGAKDPDWQPVKDAARTIAFTEDRAIFDGFAAGAVAGVASAISNPPVPLPHSVLDYPNAVAHALSALRLAGVGGPYALLTAAAIATELAETTDHGYPIRDHVARVLGHDGEIVWAPALSGAFLVSTRGGDYELYLGQDLSIGYLSHDDTSVRLYFQEAFTFLVHTTEAGVRLTAS
jgi:uncharacterized linocin/CFP29 family protein